MPYANTQCMKVETRRSFNCIDICTKFRWVKLVFDFDAFKNLRIIYLNA